MGKLLSLRGSTSNTWSEAAIVLTVLSLTLSFFALIGTEWASRSRAPLGQVWSYGLWHSCLDYLDPSIHKNVTDCQSALSGIDCGHETHHLDGWHVSCQALYPLGLIISILAVIVLTVFQCCAKYRQTRFLLISFIPLQVIGGLLMMSAVIVFSQHAKTAYPACGRFHLSWSFDVAAAASGLTIITVIVAAIQLCRFSSGFGETQRLTNETETTGSGFDNVNVVQMDSPAGSSIRQ